MEGFRTTHEQRLKELLRNASMLVNDADSFLYLRMQGLKGERGGGNWLILLGHFATLNLYSKVFTILKKGRFTTEDAKVEEAYRLLEKLKVDHPILKRLNCEPEKSINEQDAFIRLIKALPRDIDMGLTGYNDDELRKLWRDFRNTLSHMAILPVNKGGWVFDETVGYNYQRTREVIDDRARKEELKELCLPGNDTNTFYYIDQDLQCNGDLLSRDLREILLWLEGEVSNSEEANLQAAIAYIEADGLGI